MYCTKEWPNEKIASNGRVRKAKFCFVNPPIHLKTLKKWRLALSPLPIISRKMVTFAWNYILM